MEIYIFFNILVLNVVPHRRHQVSKLHLQGQGSQIQSRVLVAAQPVVQKVSSELEVILVAGLFVAVRKSDTYLPEFKGRFFFLCEDWSVDTYRRREMSLTKNLTRK